MEFTRLFLGFSNLHPVVAVAFAAAGAVVSVIAYKLIALVFDALLALVGRPRTVRTVRERLVSLGAAQETADVSEQPQPRRAAPDFDLDAVRKALIGDCKFQKKHVEAVLATVDLSAGEEAVLREAIRKLSVRKGASA